MGRSTPAAREAADGARWSREEIEALLDLPFADLLWQAQQVHREHFDPNVIERATLLSIKTGG
ncbi:MAG: biotin synthase, partial [Aquabacterium sp.]